MMYFVADSRDVESIKMGDWDSLGPIYGVGKTPMSALRNAEEIANSGGELPDENVEVVLVSVLFEREVSVKVDTGVRMSLKQ